METLKGKLRFISLFEPIQLTTANDVIDIRKIYFKVFENLNGKNAVMKYKMNEIEFISDVNSESKIKYENDDEGILILLNAEKSTSNIGAYLPDALMRLNGMKVILNYSDDSIKIEPNPEEEVYGLYYTRINSCKIPDDKIKSLCKIGEDGCCIFCTVGADGFECAKFDSNTSNYLLDRYSKGTMRANRIGNCMILGRKEEPLV